MVWSSLNSHLDYIKGKSLEGQSWHKKCVKEYAEMIKLLSEILK